MAKRHHKSEHHAHVAHDGYKMREKEQYAGREETKMMMAKDGGMIKEDWHAPCLLPRNVIDREWPRAHNYSMHMVDDLFDGAQKQLKEDYADMDREMKPGKY